MGGGGGRGYEQEAENCKDDNVMIFLGKKSGPRREKREKCKSSTGT
jgi:hypothetical protein